MIGEEFLIALQFALKGDKKAAATIDNIDAKLGRLSKRKVVTTFDAAGAATGKQIEEVYNNIGDKSKAATKGTEDFTKALARASIVAPVWYLLRGAMLSVFNLISDQIKFIKDLEDAMARIRIVGKGSEQDFENLKTSLLSLSKTYGIAASSAIESAVIFAQQGKSIDEVIKLTRIAMIGSQVLGTNMQATVNDLTAAVEAFNIPINDSIKVIDKWINVEKQFAVTSKDLAEATKIAGATANQMGVSIDSFLGDVTAIIEVTRKTGSETGRALSFIYARLLTTGKKTLEQLAQIPIYLDKQGQATFQVSNTYRSLSDILDELSLKWDGLTNATKLSIAETAGSKRQMTAFMALMQNYDAAINARIASLSSAGQAEQAFAILQDTLSVKLQQLTTSWNILTTTLGDTTVFKTIVVEVSKILEVWAEWLDTNQKVVNDYRKIKEGFTNTASAAISQRESLIELIKMRNLYLQKPPNEKNTAIIKKIESAIDNLKKSSGEINLDINAKDSIEKLQSGITTLKKKDLIVQAKLEFGEKEDKLKNQIKELKKTMIAPATGGIGFIDNLFNKITAIGPKTQELKKLETELIDLQKSRASKEEEIIQKKELENLMSKNNIDNEVELMSFEQEKINAESKFAKLKESGIFTNEQLLNMEIDMVEKYAEFETVHARTLKLAELEAKRQGEINKDIEKRVNIINSIGSYLGLQESSMIKQEMAIKAMMYGEDYINNSMEDRLKLAQALTKEAEEQNNKTSAYAITLKKITKSMGAGVAKEVASYKGGKTKYEDLGQQAQQALKRFDKGTYQQAEADKFIKDYGITSPEEIKKEVQKERNQQILNQVMIEPIQLNVNLDSNAVIDGAISAVTNALNNKKSELSKIMQDKIKNYPVGE